jgi:hypothetical protein
MITGEKLQQVADLYLGFEEDFNYNPVIRNQPEKWFRIDFIKEESFDNPRILFCYTHRLSDFVRLLPFLKNRFVLITHNSDDNIVEGSPIYKTVLSSALLIRWFAQNVCIHHEKLEVLPIGVANAQWNHGINSFFENNIVTEKIKKVYFNFSLHTNYPKRKACYDAYIDRIPFLQNIEPREYHSALSKYEFCICPEGNGVDTHRLWECFNVNTIPIVLKNEFIDVIRKKTNLPMVILDSWDELDIEKLNYNDYQIDQTALDVNYYINRIESNASDISIVLSFIGVLPSYIIENIRQSRSFFDGKIYLITDDLDSQFIETILPYNIEIVDYKLVKDAEFDIVYWHNTHKFEFLPQLKDRAFLFMRSFERMFLLRNLMLLKNIQNVFFMELDNLIYDDPRNWLNEFCKHDICYMYDADYRCSSGIMFSKNADIMYNFLKSLLMSINMSVRDPSEMTALFHYLESRPKEDVFILPTFWKSELKMPVVENKELPDFFKSEKIAYSYSNYNKFDDSIFDGAGIGVFLFGNDNVHTNDLLITGQKNRWSAVDYTNLKFEWKVDSKNRRIPYVWNGESWTRVNNLHIHSKNLKFAMSDINYGNAT